MKLMVTHDVDGRIVAIAACPPDAPAARVMTHIGQQLAEIDAPEIKADADHFAIIRHLSGLAQNYRIENGVLSKQT